MSAPQPVTTARPDRRAALAILLWLAYLLLRGVLLSQRIPPWQGPDEPGHFEYAVLLAREHARPSGPDPALESAILKSMADHDFYRWVNTPPPLQVPHTFADVPRLGGDPTQLDVETPAGYLPYAALDGLSRCCGQGEAVVQLPGQDAVVSADDVADRLRRMRLASVFLVGVTALATLWAARQSARRPAKRSDGAMTAVAVAALVTALPMLAFAGAVVNNDLPAVALAAVWFAWMATWVRGGMTRRGWWGLLVVALTAAMAKRTGVYLVPLTFGIGLWAWWRGVVGEHRAIALNGLGDATLPSLRHVAHAIRRRWIWVLGGALTALLLASWPLQDQSADWQRAGPAWGSMRTVAAARSGAWGLRIQDTSEKWWQYLEQSVSVHGGEAVTASVWMRRGDHGNPGSTSAQPVAQAQLVVNDDQGTWLGQTIVLSDAWQLVTVAGRLSPRARSVRVALVPGAGSGTDVGGLEADDATLVVAGRERLVNGGAEAPRRVGGAWLEAGRRYLGLDRIIGAVPAFLADPVAALRRGGAALGFLFRTFWGGFGWATVWPGVGAYVLAGVLTLVALLSVGISLVRPGWLAEDSGEERVLLICGWAVALALAITLIGGLAGAGPGEWPQGRYLLTAGVPWILPMVALTRRAAGSAGLGALVGVAVVLEGMIVWGTLWRGFGG